MKDVNIFSGIKHILSQRALPYHSYISTSKNKSNFHLKFSIWGRNYRTDDHQNFLQILNLSLDWYMLFLVVTDTSFSPPLKKKTEKRFVETCLTGLLILKACLLDRIFLL